MQAFVVDEQQFLASCVSDVENRSVAYEKIAEESEKYGENAYIRNAGKKKVEYFLSNETGVPFRVAAEDVISEASYIFTHRIDDREDGVRQAALLVVKDGDVIADSVLSYKQIQRELAEIMSKHEQQEKFYQKPTYAYKIFDYGHVITTDQREVSAGRSAYRVSETRIKNSIVYFNKSPFSQRKFSNRFLPLEKAASNAKIYSKATKNKIMMIATFIIVILGLGGSWIYNDMTSVVKKKDDYKNIRKVLTKTGINPEIRMANIYNAITTLDTLPGWKYNNLKIEKGKEDLLIVDVEQEKGTYKLLKSWASQNDFQIITQGSKVMLGRKDQTYPPLAKTFLMNVDDLADKLRDDFWAILPDVEVKIVPQGKKKHHKEAVLVLSLVGHSKSDIERIGSILKGYPISFEKLDLEADDDLGLYSNTITFRLIGE